MAVSTNSGPVQVQKDTLIASALFLGIKLVYSSSAQYYCHQFGARNMTFNPPNAQPIQLTPLWEHVVRTRKFPVEIDTRVTFLEIAERLRDPEWEVRQHALRVLMDVLPTLNVDLLDKVMQPVLPELINNLGHPAPAVRKGALDTIRVYLVYTQDRENIAKDILRNGLNRSEAHDPFQTNVTTGVILSAPTLLYPSSNSPAPSQQLVKDTAIALASRLAQVPHQEAVLKSLLKIREAVGGERFESYIDEYDDKLKKNIGILLKIYNIKPSKKRQKNSVNAKNAKNKDKIEKKEIQFDQRWDSDSDTSGIVEEEDEIVNGGMPAARVVLETEIKFNEETAITMTILEEKADYSENELDEESGTDVRNDAEVAEVVNDLTIERRKTPRRVHFGGEIVKLRTPDSDETESVELTPKTRIPLPVSPATKMPEQRRPSSQPCSPHREKRQVRRGVRSASSSPKREVYIHNAELSPRKSILMRNHSPLYTAVSSEDLSIKKKKNTTQNEVKLKTNAKSMQQNEELSKTEDDSSQSATDFITIEPVALKNSQSSEKNENKVDANRKTSATMDSKYDRKLLKSEDGSNKNLHEKAQFLQNKNSAFETFTNKERSYVLVERSSDEARNSKERKNDSNTQVKKSESPVVKPTEKREHSAPVAKSTRGNFSSNRRPSFDARKLSSPFGSVVDESEVNQDIFAHPNLAQQNIVDANVNAGNQSIELSQSSSEQKETAGIEAALKTYLKNNGASYSNSTNENCENLNSTGNINLNLVKEDINETITKSERVRKTTNKVEKSVIRNADGECKSKEQNWEDLGLVEPKILEDLHNREDWRARVRGLERVASALRTSSALIAIEPRLGSLLHAVLGCERSCRVAAAGLAVAKVVIAGVNEDALKKRLSLLAWGLARQGGPNAAQLARIAMLRLRPNLFLEQLLQPQCLHARNAKTRENALQLLIFSLVTFPSTEFKIQTVASKVVRMVSDRRRRVRQAALDTLAVLAQVYDPEEVLATGRKAAEGRHDGEAMISAIRARLARKSLPLVSADGLVVYGLQISPTVQIATGPDVDWIVAGSGSVSPGTGRTRGQIIAATGADKGKVTRTVRTKKSESRPWTDRSNLVALGGGLRSKVEQPVAWQIVPTQSEDDVGGEEQQESGSVEALKEVHTDGNVQTTDQSGESARNLHQHESNNSRNTENSIGKRQSIQSNDFVSIQESTSKGDSKIPVLSSSRVKVPTQTRDRSINLGVTTSGRRISDGNAGFIGTLDESSGSISTTYQRKKGLQHETVVNKVSRPNAITNQSSDSYSSNHRPFVNGKHFSILHSSYNGSVDNVSQESAELNTKPYRKFPDRERFLGKSVDKLNYTQSISRNSQQDINTTSPFNVHRQPERFLDVTGTRLQTAPTPHTQSFDGNRQYYQYSTLSRLRPTYRMQDAAVQKQVDEGLASSETQTNGYFPPIDNEPPYRRRLRSLSPSQLYRRQQQSRLTSSEYHAASMYDIDKAVNEAEYNKKNKILFLPGTVPDHEEAFNTIESGFEANDYENNTSKIASRPPSSTISKNDLENDEHIVRAEQQYEDSSSSTPSSQDGQVAFNVIRSETSRVIEDSINTTVIALEQRLESVLTGASESVGEDTSKEWSSDDDTNLRNHPVSRISNCPEFDPVEEDERDSITFDDAIDQEEDIDTICIRRKSAVSILSDERITPAQDFRESSESSVSNDSKDFPTRRASLTEKVSSPGKVEGTGSQNSPQKVMLETGGFTGSTENQIAPSILNEENTVFQPFSTVSSFKEDDTSESPTIIIASRPHSSQADYIENKLDTMAACDAVDDAQTFIGDSRINETLEDGQSKDSASETNTEPAILRIESETVEPIIPTRRLSSKMPRGTKMQRTLGSKSNTEKMPDKSKSMVQQCFAQLENKDWEVTLKGLKTLSQIAKQHPEYLETCAVGTIGRILGRLIKSLRSQVARAACLAAGDIFAAHIRSIDQDIDDIVGPLLHRTADTNRFLRGDSNAALDRMVEHLPPHKIIGVIVHRGAYHQNAIVRAATARLLAAVVDRVGPEHTMILPRDVRDKLLNTGAKLLMDGSLDARNHAKKLFRRLIRCDGFRRALTDAVPETTLRHIDKTLRSL